MSSEQTGPRYVKHELKIWPEYFDDVQSGEKGFDVRKDDRPFEVGNILLLREFNPNTEEYTGREMAKRIRYILRESEFAGVAPGFCILGLHNL